MPSADVLLAEVLGNHCGSLQHKVSLGETRELGIFRTKDGIPFVFEIDWQLDKGKPGEFHIQIHHIRPRSEKLMVTRHIRVI